MFMGLILSQDLINHKEKIAFGLVKNCMVQKYPCENVKNVWDWLRTKYASKMKKSFTHLNSLVRTDLLNNMRQI